MNAWTSDRHMTRRAFLSLAAASGVLSLSACGEDDTSSLDDPMDLKEEKSVRVGSDCDYPPYEWLIDEDVEDSLPVSNKDGSYAVGFDVLLMKEIGERFGCQVVLVNLDHAQLIEYLGDGLVDIVISAYGSTVARSETAAFSEGYNPYRLAVVTRKDSSYASATTIDDLSGARVSVKDSTIVAEIAGTIPNVTVLDPYATMGEAYGAVVDGEADIVIVDKTAWSLRESSWPSLVMTQIASEDLPMPGDGYMHIAVRKDETVMLEEIDEMLDELGEDGLAELWDKTCELETLYEQTGEASISQ